MNVIGDSFGAGIVYHLSKKELNEQDRARERLEASEEMTEFSESKHLKN